jgi:hypothetical protein
MTTIASKIIPLATIWHICMFKIIDELRKTHTARQV